MPSQWVSGRIHNLQNIVDYRAMYQRSIDDPHGFWTDIAAGFEWRGKPLKDSSSSFNFDRNKGSVFIKWFEGSTTNLAWNCLDRQISMGRGNQVAMFSERNGIGETGAFQPESYTYSELRDEVNKLANVLLARGVQRGDRVAIFMAHTPENCIAMLACARIGAVHTVVFGGFSKEALAGRIIDSGAKVLITQDGVMRGGKLLALKQIADGAVPLVSASGSAIETMIVLQRLGTTECAAVTSLAAGRDLWWHEATATASKETETEWLDAESPAFILYTSGSTGKPKGILHSIGGYMIGAATTFKYTFDVQAHDVFFCTADCGWITGHSYVTYGPLLNGATQVVFEGVPSYPSAVSYNTIHVVL